MDAKTRIGQVNAAAYAGAGSLTACAGLEERLSFDALKAEADESWKDSQTITLTFDYPAHTVYVSFSPDGRYLCDSMDFEREAAEALPPFPRTAGEMDGQISRGVRCAERFALDGETVYLLPNGMTVHYVGEEDCAPLVRIAGSLLGVKRTRDYLHGILRRK